MEFALVTPNNPVPAVETAKIRDFNRLVNFEKWVQKPFFVVDAIDFGKQVIEWAVTDCALSLDWYVALFQVTSQRYYLPLGYLQTNGVGYLFFDESESTDLVILPNPQVVTMSFKIDFRVGASSGGSLLSGQVFIIE